MVDQAAAPPTVGSPISALAGHDQMNRASLRPGVNGTVTSLTFCNLIDLPAITLPAWSDPDPVSGLPPGIMLACAPGSEAALMAAARCLEPMLNPYLAAR